MPPAGQPLYLMDARPRVNSFANQAVGRGGTENTTWYKNVALEFLGIGKVVKTKL
jgi:hypothetical protein